MKTISQNNKTIYCMNNCNLKVQNTNGDAESEIPWTFLCPYPLNGTAVTK